MPTTVNYVEAENAAWRAAVWAKPEDHAARTDDWVAAMDARRRADALNAINPAHRAAMIDCATSWARKHGMTYYVVSSLGCARYILTARPSDDETVLLTINPSGEVS